MILGTVALKLVIWVIKFSMKLGYMLGVPHVGCTGAAVVESGAEVVVSSTFRSTCSNFISKSPMKSLVWIVTVFESSARSS